MEGTVPGNLKVMGKIFGLLQEENDENLVVE